MKLMKALTVWQPWASFIAIEAKPYEFRGWRPPASIIGERIAIHAGARPMKLLELRNLLNALCDPNTDIPTPCLHRDKALPLLQRILDEHSRAIPRFLPLSHVLCTAVVGEPKPGNACAREFGETAGNDSDREGTFNWGWPMLDVQPLTPPAPATGLQGLWNWSQP